MPVNPIPDGYHSVTAYLSVANAAKAIEFYIQALNAVERFRLETPDGGIAHAEIQLGDSNIMLADGCDDGSFKSPEQLGGSSVGLMVYVDNVDELFAQAVSAGAQVIEAIQDQFYGDRTGRLQDPFGHIWFLATHIEDLSPEQINQRAEKLFMPDNG